MNEWWAAIWEWPQYMVSTHGRVKRVMGGRGCRPDRILKQRVNRDGYACVTLYQNNTKKGFLVSRLVCGAFCGPTPIGDYHAAHKDGDRSNNHYSNLRWASRVENEADKELHGTRCRGERYANSKLTEQVVRAIRSDTRPQRQIAEEYGIAQGLVSMVKNRKVWAHV